MIDLPHGLAAWAPQLAVLPSDLALALAPWMGRLALAIGPLSATHTQHSGEPDGYSGLQRRGSYERLVTTEWGVAELFPDEFLRRAASGEHLFLQLARREPRGAARTIALVSAGPAQLGAPRLAHVAALIVLARRAADAGAGFAWGVLEDREHRLHEVLDEASLSQLLAARTAVAAGPGACKSWLDAFGPEPNPDVWLIGGDDDAAQAAEVGASTLIVRDVLEPRIRALDLEIERRGRQARVRLDLPAPGHCARLLRDPFARSSGSSSVARSHGVAVDVRFAPGGRRLIVCLADGTFESWPVPSSPRDKPGNPRAWAPSRSHAVLALGIGRRSLLAATATRDDPTAIELHYAHNHAIRVMVPKDVATAIAECIAARITPPLGTCALVRLRTHERADLILEVLGRLLVVPGFTLWPEPGTVLTALPFHGAGDDKAPLAIATAFFPASFVWAERGDGYVRVFEATSSGNRSVALVGAFAEPEVRFGFSMPQSQGWGAVAVSRAAGPTRVASPTLACAQVKTVVPFMGVSLWDGVPALLTRPHPNRLAWLIGDRRDLLPTAGAPIVAVAVCPSQPNLAWVTATGEVILYSLQHRAVVLRRVPGELP